ncbi:MAG TPA: hypothetical protein VFF53_12410 [Geobacteraceae bacterium]|nr:hypothetical protein [Geobacteraceae bacterium]
MKRIEVMNRAKFVKQGTRMVFLFDLSSLDTDDALQVIHRGEDVIGRMPEKSVLTLVDISDNHQGNLLKEFTVKLVSKESTFISKVAFSGVSEQSVIKEWSDLMSSIGNNFKAFKHAVDAVGWLTETGAA